MANAAGRIFITQKVTKKKCEKCGAWLYEYIKKKEVSNIREDVKEISEKTKQRDTVVCKKCKGNMVPIRHTGLGSGGRSLMCPLCGAGYSTFDYKLFGAAILVLFLFLALMILVGKCSQ